MAVKSISYHPKVLRFYKIKATTKVWKIQIQLPMGVWLKNSTNVETTKWTIWQLLN